MIDVRALLRSERASRRITDPLATYTSAGQLSCSVCRTNIKSESLWDSHIQSPRHTQAGLRAATEASQSSRKRKAVSDEFEERKKSRPDVHEPLQDDIEDIPTNIQTEEAQSPTGKNDAPPIIQSGIDEDEWAAFERDVATPPPTEPKTSLSALTAPASIQAQPLTAAELSAQAREQQSSQRDQRQAEQEAEKEEASRALEDEFEEMEALEMRVKRLRDQREALRRVGGERGEAVVAERWDADATGEHEDNKEKLENEAVDEDEEDDDDDEDDLAWGFGRS